MTEQDYSKGGWIQGPGVPIVVKPLTDKQPGDIDDVLLNKDLDVVGRIRWNADGSMSYRP